MLIVQIHDGTRLMPGVKCRGMMAGGRAWD